MLAERLGAGGFGEVWRAHPLASDACPGEVALKVATRPEAIAALRREGAIQSRLHHPGIVRVLAQDLENDPPYVVFEHCPLGSFRDLLRRAAALRADLPLLEMFTQIAEALACAHEHGAVHGDLKPENIVLDIEGRPKITDFGLGTTRAGGEVQLSRSLASVELGGGTLAYLPPERHTGAPADPSGDVWAMGVMLFEASFGRLPEGIEELDWPLGRLFGKCYAPRRRRIPDGRALHRALMAYAPPPVRAPPAPPIRPAARPLNFLALTSRGDRRVLALAAVFLLPLFLSVGAVIFSPRGATARTGAGPFFASPVPSLPDEVEVRRLCLELAGTLRGFVGERAAPWRIGEGRSALEPVEQPRARAERLGYRLVPSADRRSIRAEPRVAGWPSYDLDAENGALRKVVRR